MLISKTVFFMAMVVILGIVSASDITITSFERDIDITEYNVVINVALEVQNNGKGAVEEIVIPVRKGGLGSVCWIECVKGGSVDHSSVVVDDDVTYLTVKFPKALGSKETLDVEVDVTVCEGITAHPHFIGQDDAQYVVFHDYEALPSEHTIDEQTTLVNLPSKRFNEPDEVTYTQDDTTLTYGPHADGEGERPLSVHLEFNAHMALITELRRDIQVSAWGDVDFEDDYVLYHNGAALSDGFSRIDFQRNTRSGRFAMRKFTRGLDLGASGIYYRDVLGNISSSAVREVDNGLELDIQPRFVMFGDWHTEFTVGYSLRMDRVVKRLDDGRNMLVVPVGAAYDSTTTQHNELTIALPEGATNIEVALTHPSYALGEPEFGIRKTYLDTTGRPTVTIEFGEMSDEAGEEVYVQVMYSYSNIFLVKKLVTVVVAVGVLMMGFVFSKSSRC